LNAFWNYVTNINGSQNNDMVLEDLEVLRQAEDALKPSLEQIHRGSLFDGNELLDPDAGTVDRNPVGGGTIGGSHQLLVMVFGVKGRLSKAAFKQISIERRFPDGYQFNRFTCKDGWLHNGQNINWSPVLTDPPIKGLGKTEADCRAEALASGHLGYYFDWNQHWRGWCRFLLSGQQQQLTDAMVSEKHWHPFSTGHTCILSGETPISKIPVPYAPLCHDCRDTPALTGDAGDSICRDGWPQNFVGVLSDPPEMKVATEKECLQRAVIRGYSGIYYDENTKGYPWYDGWCRYVLDVDNASTAMLSGPWVYHSTGRTCVLKVSAGDQLVQSEALHGWGAPLL
jgi:hypothetical protein